MKKLQSYLKLLSIGSVIVLAGTTISCSNINNSATRNFVIPTVNRRPNNSSNESNSNEDSRNNTTPENTQPVNNDQSSNHNSNNINSDNSINRNKTPIDGSYEANNTFVNGQTYFSTISNVSYNLTSFDNNYLKYEEEEFKPQNLDDSKINEILLNDKLPLNFYSHPKYKQQKQYIILNPESSTQLKLVDSKNNTEVSDGVKWYQRLRYPESKILKADSEENDKLTLSTSGTVKGKKHSKENDPVTLIWAEYKGYLYPFFVEVPSEHHFKGDSNNEEAKKVAKKLAEEWKNLPTLEKITKAYEWMTKEVMYDPGYKTNSLLKDQTAYSALVEKCTVCTGYAKGFKMIMDELSIPCRVMEGQSGRDAGAARHAWNLIEVDGEWYHVDPTSDRTHDKATFNFFFNSNEDFSKKDSFERDLGIYGSRFRNYKNENFVHSKEDALTLIDNKISDKDKNLTLELTSDNFTNVNKAFEERNLEISKFNYLETKLPFKKVKYFLQNKNSSTSVKNIKAKIKNETFSNNDLGKYSLKVSFSSNDMPNDLQPKNFNVKNAMVKEAKKVGDGYLLLLDHFTSFGSVEVEIQSIKRQGFKIDIDGNNKFTFNVEKHTKPDVKLKIDKNNRITLVGSKKGMQYRSNLNQWTDITSDDFVIDNPSVGKLSVRWKDYNNKFASDIQIFEVSRANDVVNKVKLVNNNMLIGLDNTMEYKKESDTSWKKVTSQTLKGLASGTYLIRTSASDLTLASDISKVEIR
ncbi:MAG6410 family transglutaminase-related lipoprotein [Mycoplasma feriruminatoris]|uniref:Lipoprotein n=1 Tax=Mycoplasma feriruminatoris TaxID=1179777 RepID=A0AAQ3DNF5_9MOLU|nr:transglutaminase domain-containing protein [Mycoplasma feriruminatoris]WFQ95213.1 lipoprotein [Mycoplasma feriruminatoris]